MEWQGPLRSDWQTYIKTKGERKIKIFLIFINELKRIIAVKTYTFNDIWYQFIVCFKCWYGKNKQWNTKILENILEINILSKKHYFTHTKFWWSFVVIFWGYVHTFVGATKKLFKQGKITNITNHKLLLIVNRVFRLFIWFSCISNILEVIKICILKNYIRVNR